MESRKKAMKKVLTVKKILKLDLFLHTGFIEPQFNFVLWRLRFVESVQIFMLL